MKHIIPYPLLLITAIILDRIAISSTQIGAAQSLRSLLVLLLLTTIAIVMIQHRVKDWHYANFAVLAIWVMLLAYRALYGFLKVNVPQQADYLGLALLPLLSVVYALSVSRKIWQSIHDPSRITYYFNLVFTLLLIFQVVRLARDSYNLFITTTSSQFAAVSELNSNIRLQNKTRPDIYVIVLDGYARQDVLREIYQYDNSEFISNLEKRGFFVASNSHSNYVQTHYSMASFWNFDYLRPWHSSSNYAQYLLQPIQNNRAFHLLDEIGYKTVTFESEVDYIDIKNSDIHLSKFLPFNKFEDLLLIDSPFEPLSNIFNLGIPIPTYKTHRQRIQYELDTLKKIPTAIDAPKIVYAHIVAPHPPFVFDQDGNALQYQRQYSLWDNSTYEGGHEEYWKGYREQVIFVNAETIKVVDAILEKSKTPPIILIMGDHGPASLFNWNFDTPGCIWERTSNLYAILLPEKQSNELLYPSISPVNTFRVIFNTYFGTHLPYLEDKSYLMSWQQPTLKIDVTDVRDSRQGCAISDR